MYRFNEILTITSGGRTTIEQLRLLQSSLIMRIPVVVVIAIFLSSLVLFTIVPTNPTTMIAFKPDVSLTYNTNAFAQKTPQENVLNSIDKILIEINSIRFAPLTDSTVNQLKILVTYQAIDPMIVNTPMTGIMKVYQSDGSLLKTSSIPKGYVVGQSGIVQFATSFADQNIQDVRTKVYMINTQGDVISNILSVDASLVK